MYALFVEQEGGSIHNLVALTTYGTYTEDKFPETLKIISIMTLFCVRFSIPNHPPSCATSGSQSTRRCSSPWPFASLSSPSSSVMCPPTQVIPSSQSSIYYSPSLCTSAPPMPPVSGRLTDILKPSHTHTKAFNSAISFHSYRFIHSSTINTNTVMK